jgi:curved DNA-binding protein
MIDYYNVLGVPKTASAEEIKKSYRKLAMKHHPDRNGGDDTEFKKIQEAYDVLGNAESRSAYDNPPSAANFNFGEVPPEFQDFMNNFGNFSQFFGGRAAQQRNKTLNLHVQLSLTEAFYGKDLMAEIKLPSGRNQLINAKIPPGVHNGTNVRLTGLGDDSFTNKPRGDIILTIQVINNTVFERHGDDLLKTEEISMWDAALGALLTIESIDNKFFEIKINPGTQHGQIMAIPNAGMPLVNSHQTRGRMLIKILVKIPTLLSEEQKTLLEKSKLA